MIVPLMFVCLGLAGLFFWAARLPSTWRSIQTRLRGGALILLFLAVFLGFAFFQQTQATADLKAVIPVYPGAESTGWFPQVSEDRYWVLESDDDLVAVVEFYELVADESGWNLDQHGDNRLLSITLERAGTEVSIQLLRNRESTQITYIVTN